MILIIITIIIWIFLIIITKQNTVINNKYNAYFITVCLFIYVSILLIISENNTSDMEIYVREFTKYSNHSLIETLDITNKEYLFTLFQWLTSKISTNPQFFFVSIWLFFGSILLFSLNKIFNARQLLIIFFSYLNYFIFFPYITNTVRQGFAIAILMYAVCILISNKKSKLFYVSIFVAPFFHSSSIPLSVALLLLRNFNLNLNTLLVIWILSAITFVTDMNELLFGSFSKYIPEIEAYTSASVLERYTGGVNRLDFLVFSLFWIVLSLIAWKKLTKTSFEYATLIKIYLLFNIYFLLFGFIGFSDRIATYSWFLVPILIWYPVLKQTTQKYNLLILSILLVFIIYSFAGGSLLYN